jgi:hypothetical protein
LIRASARFEPRCCPVRGTVDFTTNDSLKRPKARATQCPPRSSLRSGMIRTKALCERPCEPLPLKLTFSTMLCLPIVARLTIRNWSPFNLGNPFCCGSSPPPLPQTFTSTPDHWRPRFWQLTGRRYGPVKGRFFQLGTAQRLDLRAPFRRMAERFRSLRKVEGTKLLCGIVLINAFAWARLRGCGNRRRKDIRPLARYRPGSARFKDHGCFRC